MFMEEFKCRRFPKSACRVFAHASQKAQFGIAAVIGAMESRYCVATSYTTAVYGKQGRYGGYGKAIYDGHLNL